MKERIYKNHPHQGKTMSKRAWKYHDLLAHDTTVNSASLGHKSGRVLVTGGGDKKVNLWAVGKPSCILTLTGHSTPVDCVRFSNAEDQVCAGSQAGALKIWDLETAKMLRTLTGHRASIRSVDFHPYGDFLASGSADSGIKMWDLRKKGCIFGYKGHSSTVNSLKFSPDGQWIASGGDDNMVKIWDIRVGKILIELTSHTAPVTGVEFHPHEFLLATGSSDRTVKFWDLEKLELLSSSKPDAPSVKAISFHPDGSCLFAASSESLRVHGWEPAVVLDALPASWMKVQDIATSGEQLVGVSIQSTTVSIHIVDLHKVNPFKNSTDYRASHSNHLHSLRKSFSTARSIEFEESLHAMKGNEDSDGFPTDLEDESLNSQPEIRIPNDFRTIFNPRRDLCRTPPPFEDFLPPTDEEPSSSLSQSTGTDNETTSPNLEYENTKRRTKFKFVTERRKSPPESPRRSSVPAINAPNNYSPPQTQHLYNNIHPPRCRSPDLYSRQSSLSDDSSSGPVSSRSVESSRTNNNHQLPAVRGIMTNMKHSPSEPMLYNHSQNIGHERNKYGNSLSPIKPSPLHPIPRSPERPLAQCQVKPMLKPPVKPEPVNTNFYIKTETIPSDVPVPSISDRPVGLSIEDFLPKKTPMAFQGGVQIVDIDESKIFTNLTTEHQPLVGVLAMRQRNLRIIHTLWLSRDIKAAIDTAVGLHDISVLVDLLGILNIRPQVWNLDLCVALLPPIMSLVQSKYEAHILVGCESIRLVMQHFGSVIKTNIESPIATVGVDISREERYNKSKECYDRLIDIRSFAMKRQTVPGKTGEEFRKMFTLLSKLA